MNGNKIRNIPIMPMPIETTSNASNIAEMIIPAIIKMEPKSITNIFAALVLKVSSLN